jgi:hypothetical protein
MTPVAILLQKIASEYVATQVPFTRSMLNLLRDRLHNVSKHCQFCSPFDSKGCRPDVPHTKALPLMKKIKNDKSLNMYL